MKKEYEDEAMSCAQVVAWGICLMLVCLGIGGCIMLGQSKVDVKFDNSNPALRASATPR